MNSASALAALPRALPAHGRVYLRPVGLLSGDVARDMCAAARARPLAGGPLAFALCEIIVRLPGNVEHAVAEVPQIETWAAACDPVLGPKVRRRLDLLSASRDTVVSAPALMGIINVTPDSF